MSAFTSLFTADTFLASDVLPSPNHEERAGHRAPDMIGCSRNPVKYQSILVEYVG